jgi:hypothetical protein
MLGELLTVATLILPLHTPGERSPAVSQADVHRTVCMAGYTSTVRPPTSFTNALKNEQLRAWHYQDQNPRDFEEDHLIPLSLGGAPRNPRNLWPESWAQAHVADAVEYAEYRQMCDGKITLADAQRVVIRWKRQHG